MTVGGLYWSWLCLSVLSTSLVTPRRSTSAGRGTRKTCVDCERMGITTRRKTPHPGPRCSTHHKAKRRESRSSRQVAHVFNTYGITEEEYDAILEAQGGVCYICRRKPGRKRLSVDHDHNKPCCGTEHPKEKGCPKCVRGLLHGKDNSFLGWTLDDPETWERGAEYLRNPPAQRVLAQRRGSQ